jgi:hypothetical protein
VGGRVRCPGVWAAPVLPEPAQRDGDPPVLRGAEESCSSRELEGALL